MVGDEAEERGSQGLRGGVPFVEDGAERPVPRDDVEVHVRVETAAASRQRTTQDHTHHPVVVPEVVHRAFQQSAVFREPVEVRWPIRHVPTPPSARW